jgi:hypothetical protein
MIFVNFTAVKLTFWSPVCEHRIGFSSEKKSESIWRASHWFWVLISEVKRQGRYANHPHLVPKFIKVEDNFLVICNSSTFKLVFKVILSTR